MVGIWAGKIIGPEVEARAAIEAKATGHPITKNGLSREIFLWAFEIYCQVGSLAALKELKLANLSHSTKVPDKVVPPHIAAKINAQVKELVNQQKAAEEKVLERIRPSKRKRVVNQ